MAYSPYYAGGWQDSPSTATPIVAAALNNMETGISAASTVTLDGTASDIQPAGTQAAGATGKAADAGHVHPADGGPRPSDVGLLAWTFDTVSVGGTSVPTAGNVVGTAMWVRRTITVANLIAAISSAGSGLTSGQCFGLLYYQDGTLVAKTADQAATWAGAAAVQTMALSAVTSLTLQPGMYWGAVLSNGTTSPTFRSCSASPPNALINVGRTAAQSRCGTLATVVTSPGNITPSSINQTGSAIWFALS